MTTLENLYYGNIAPHEFEVVCGSEYDITAKLVIRYEQELSATLTEQQKIILENGLTERHARALLKLPSDTLKFQAMDAIKTFSMTAENISSLFSSLSNMRKPVVPTRPSIKIFFFIFSTDFLP